MKTKREVSTAVVTTLVMAAMLLLVGIMGFANREWNGQSQQAQATTPLVDNGSSASLSNQELVSVAITNMKALRSYHFEFKGGMPSMEVRMSSNLSITGDVQLHGNGARWKVRDEGGDLSGTAGTFNFDVGAGIDGIRATGDHWYESYDGGKTWAPPTSGDSLLSFLLLWLDCRWGNLFEDVEETGDPTICEAAARYTDFRDGTPRLENIDGTITRHMTGVYGSEQAQANGQALTVDIWVSTDLTPTLRQMRMQGSNKIFENIVEQVNEFAFSPDGKMLAAAHGWTQDATIRLYDLNSSGAPQRKLTNGKYSFESVAYSPDGTMLAATSVVPVGNGPIGVYIWDLTKQDPIPMIRTLPEDVSFVAFEPDGKMLIACTSSGAYLLDPLDATVAPTVLPLPGGVFAFSPDGHTLAAWAQESGVLIYDRRNLKQDPIRLQHEGPEYDWNEHSVDHVAFGPDGKLLATVREGHINVWDRDQPQVPLVTLPAKLGQYPSAAFSPDGKFLATLGAESDVEIWDVSVLKNTATARTPMMKLDCGSQARLTHLAFSPNGETLAVSTEEGSVLMWKTADMLTGQAAGPQVFREERVLIDKDFTLNWTWSHFNDDFGQILPPPTETIKHP